MNFAKFLRATFFTEHIRAAASLYLGALHITIMSTADLTTATLLEIPFQLQISAIYTETFFR